MKAYLNYFFTRFDFPADAIKAFLAAYDCLEKNEAFVSLLDRFYKNDGTITRSGLETDLDEVSAAASVHPYTAKFLYYVCLSKQLPEKYANVGIPEDVLWETLEDFKYKFDECMDVHGIPGFFANPWFYKFMTLEQFKLGRLEFELSTLPSPDVTIAGRTLTEGTPVISIHIPSAGGKFDRAARFASYKRAYEFFNNVLHKDIDVFRCGSWLLYSPNREILPPYSNVISFMDDFKIYTCDDFGNPRADLWRIFGADATKPFEELPRDNSMKRAYAERLASGKPVGSGKGVFIWDNVNNTTITE